MHSPMPSSQLWPKLRNSEVLHTEVLMGTFVTIHVVGEVQDPSNVEQREHALDRAFEWFRRVEECCTRFDPSSELLQLTAQVGVPVRVSALVYEAVQFALAVAEQSGGAFDPTLGHAMETRGFNREYRTGKLMETALNANGAVSYRDVRLDPEAKTITLLHPLILDLGAVAKGLAVDLAARELRPFKDFAINAGGDLYLGGCNPEGEPWSVGIRHPRQDGLIDCLRISDRAVCTSGDYERRTSDEQGHHILNPRTGSSPDETASVTVIAPNAMLADALATAAFVLGPTDGIELFNRMGVDGLIVTPQLRCHATRGLGDYR
jgi:FAD:protein FMN transferase